MLGSKTPSEPCMRILVHHFAVLGDLGGVNRVVRDLALGLQVRGNDIGIIEMGNEWKARRNWDGGIPMWTIAKPSALCWHRPRSWASNARSAWQLERVIRDFQPDIINVHFPCSQISVLKWLA